MKLVTYYQEIGNDYAFTSNEVRKSGIPDYRNLSEDMENSDEDQYDHSILKRLVFKPFEEEKNTYSLYAIQLIKSYEEIKKRSAELDYIYGHVFKYNNCGKFDIPCETVHLGLFYEIVLSDPCIVVIFKLRQKLKGSK